MADLSDRVPIPPKDQMNTNLSSATEATMLAVFGRPGNLTDDCSDPTGPFVARVKWRVDVGPFEVSGLDIAVESLRQLFAEVKLSAPALHEQVQSDGMLCVRHRRANPARYSNHSWGAAIDLYFGDAAVPQGTRLCHRGNMLLAPYFQKYGWYWGAEFSGDSVDSMHFEFAEETILKLAPLTHARQTRNEISTATRKAKRTTRRR